MCAMFLLKHFKPFQTDSSVSTCFDSSFSDCGLHSLCLSFVKTDWLWESMGYVVHTCCICCTSLIGIKIAAVGGRATLSKTWKRRRWRIAHQANYQCWMIWMENWWKLHLRVPIVPWCPHPHLQIGCWDRLWMTTKTLLRSAAWLWARLPAALTFARSDPSILVINVIKIPTHHISSLCPCPARCMFNQKLLRKGVSAAELQPGFWMLYFVLKGTSSMQLYRFMQFIHNNASALVRKS